MAYLQCQQCHSTVADLGSTLLFQHQFLLLNSTPHVLGVAYHLTNDTMPLDNIYIKGFINKSTSQVKRVGLNSDSKSELYIPTMPSDLVLICAADYT